MRSRASNASAPGLTAPSALRRSSEPFSTARVLGALLDAKGVRQVNEAAVVTRVQGLVQLQDGATLLLVHVAGGSARGLCAMFDGENGSSVNKVAESQALTTSLDAARSLGGGAGGVSAVLDRAEVAQVKETVTTTGAALGGRAGGLSPVLHRAEVAQVQETVATSGTTLGSSTGVLGTVTDRAEIAEVQQAIAAGSTALGSRARRGSVVLHRTEVTQIQEAVVVVITIVASVESLVQSEDSPALLLGSRSTRALCSVLDGEDRGGVDEAANSEALVVGALDASTALCGGTRVLAPVLDGAKVAEVEETVASLNRSSFGHGDGQRREGKEGGVAAHSGGPVLVLAQQCNHDALAAHVLKERVKSGGGREDGNGRGRKR
ncbi:hypothetical protein FA10DRAFT_193230 [Acaromyces ingoldii]|uniref:Uncharacterized protein n=1 Tax=Acaromyces ingoldii TaxID=215250 RepID=A0A316YC33_9BASI|nr:hypothetical protein FA10DRAFT_193230 [Acaromyces ingoldii]PWN87057.1 hypothetical protein FA10DRAFT_193230 [Acaromyces ingoldii]